MKNIKTKNKRTVIIPIIICLLVAGVVAGFFIWKHNNRPKTISQSVNYSPATKEQKQAGEEQKINNIEKGENSSGGTQTEEERAVISSANVNKLTNQLVVMTQIYGTGFSRCTLTLTQGSKIVTKQADILYQSTYSTCMGFAVDRAELDNGTWNVKLDASKADGTIKSATTTTTLEAN